MSSGSRPATAMARLPAMADSVAVVSCAAAMRLSRMPVRVRIHSSEVSTTRSSSALVSTRSGAYMPQPVTRTLFDVMPHSLRSSRLELDQRLLGLDQRPALDADARHPAGNVALDLVEQLHRLDEADHLAGQHVRAFADVRLGTGRWRAVVNAGQRSQHGADARVR